MWTRCLRMRGLGFGLASLNGRIDEIVRSAFAFVVQCLVRLAELRNLVLDQSSYCCFSRLPNRERISGFEQHVNLGS
jgi:hypothetical protein